MYINVAIEINMSTNGNLLIELNVIIEQSTVTHSTVK